MGNKLDEQTPRVYLENFLTMGVMHLLVRSKPWILGALPCAEGTVSGSGYFTNALILSIVNGPTEGLALIYGLHFMTAIVGAQWWAQPFQQSIPFLSWIPYVNELPTYKAAVYLLTPIAILPTVACNISNVHKIVKARKGSMLLALAMLYPFVVLMGGVLIWLLTCTRRR
ncbi:choline/ethanolaminephosphotransferase 1 isoform X5 [Gossypium hirsutum]|uniref:Choline/ethanolaminephosphotransferase 1 isoform X5 n=1 Tax=Gossypium hirsutum TaxID=3635 RepID=A0ABM2Z5Q9_GOSHI|nr:choline/ethanolaminephosphotransferase 1-like isoform X5 [Gossypium hirsutum]XP_040937339.1 choline/ethanolaminephosphotransferase 1-like isoform X5 [Gossypium hirsutum]